MTETELRADMGRAGGIARAKGMSKSERRASAIKAAKARWAGKGLTKGIGKDQLIAFQKIADWCEEH